ncbi:MAG TPA: DMT family transporter [Candidatus Limnocylindrales bacterium]|nr:DMT family transporter [Candidatus Limnocylindrales bacterium]
MPATRASVAPTDLLLLLFLGAVWGGAFLFFRIAGPEVGPVWAAEARVTIAALTLAVVGLPTARRTLAGRWRQVVVLGAFMSAIPFSLIAFATTTLPTGLGALLNATAPLFTVLVGAAWVGDRVGSRTAVGLALGLFAVPVAVGFGPLELGPDTLLAAAASLGAAFSYAIGGIYARLRLRDMPPVSLATGQLASAAILLLPVAMLTGTPGVPSAGGIVSLLALGTVSTALAWPLYFGVTGRTSPTAASTVTFVVPVFGIAWGAIALGEPVGLGVVGGFVLVLASLVLVLGLRVPVPAVARRVLIPRRAALRPSAAG